jgi:hypothetical protein
MEGCASRAEARRVLRDFKATTTGCAILADREGGAVYELTPKNIITRPAEEGICTCTNHFCSPELAVPTEERCWRYDKLEEYRKRPKLDVADVAKALDDVNNQGKATALHDLRAVPVAGAYRPRSGLGQEAPPQDLGVRRAVPIKPPDVCQRAPRRGAESGLRRN